MTDQERAMLLAIDQLREARRRNEILTARVDTMELMSHFLFAMPPRGGSVGAGEDAAWLLQRELDKMKEAQSKQPPTIDELEAILNSDDGRDINVNPDGSISAASGGLTGGKIAGDGRAIRSGR
jgi:hypothetical protein